MRIIMGSMKGAFNAAAKAAAIQREFRTKILELADKLNNKKDGKEAAHQLISKGRDPKTRQQTITILQDRIQFFQDAINGLKEIEKLPYLPPPFTPDGITETINYYERLIKNIERVLSEIQKS